MKMLCKLLMLTSASLFVANISAESKFNPGDQKPTTYICISAVEDNRLVFKNKVKSYRYPMKVVAQKIKCNGERIASFARTYGNKSVYKTLSRFDKPRVKIYETVASTK